MKRKRKNDCMKRHEMTPKYKYILFGVILVDGNFLTDNEGFMDIYILWYDRYDKPSQSQES